MTRSKTDEDRFEEIGETCLYEAGRVDCPAYEYRSGLRGIISQIRVAIQASEEMDGGDEDDGA